MAQLCQGLQARGHSVSVITTFPHYEKFRVWDEFRGKLFERVTYAGLDVLRLYVYAYGNKGSMLHRLLSYLSFSVLATLAAFTVRDTYDLILCSNGSFFSGIAASIIARARGIPFIYNVQDLYPETPVQAGQLHNRFAIALLERLERFMYARAAHVTVISPAFRRNVISKGIPAEKVSTIPNFVDTQFIRRLPKANTFSEQHGLENKFVVLQAGNLGYVYDLDTLIDAAMLLRNEAGIVFLIIGDGVMKQRLQERAAQLPNVRFLPFQPEESVPLMRATADIQVALYKRGSGRYSMPSKLYEIMASGRPVLASADPGTDLWQLVNGTQCGVCIEPGDPNQLASVIQHLYSDPALRERMGQRGRLEAEQHYSQQAVVAQYDTLCRALSSPSESGVPAPERIAL